MRDDPRERWNESDKVELGPDYLRRTAADRVPLSAEEDAWLAAHRVLRAGIDQGWAPVEFADDKGVPQGISAAYLQRLEAMLGIHFELVVVQNWQQALHGLEEGTLDILPAASATPGRQAKMRFTEPYLSLPAAIFSAADIAYLGGLQALEGKTVAVIQDEAPLEWLRADWPQLELVPVTDTREALRQMAKGRVFAFVGNLVTTSYYVGESGHTQIKVSGETPYAFRLGMAVRPDQPALSGILQKGLAAIPQHERDAIYHEWISIHYKHQVDYSLLWRISAAALSILLIIAYWNRRLAGEIGRRRVAEAELRVAKEAADRANRTKSDFLANASHDLRTPLNAILGYTQLLEGDGRLAGQDRTLVHGIRRGGERLLGLVDELLDLAKIEADRFESVIEEWDSGDLLRELDGTFRPPAQAKGIALVVEAMPALPRRLSCDAKRLHRVLANLMDNAIKYTDAGSVTLRAGFETGYLTFEVADTGVGIPAGETGRIFEPFQRMEAAGQRAGGCGLGLAIAKRLIERMGGMIAVESTPAQGSRFRLRIPAAPAGDGEKPGPDGWDSINPIGYRRTEGDEPLRILVVDDEGENRAVLRGLLESLGFAVWEAGGGRPCLDIAEDWMPDLIFMDLRMPDMDGLAATRILRKHPALRDTPIVAVTASAFMEDRAEVRAAGCDDYLAKPVFREALIGVLGRLLPLTWQVGAGAADTAAPSKIETLPQTEIERLARLIGSGGITAIQEFAETLAREGVCPDLARRIGKLAEDFDLEGLRRLLAELPVGPP